MNLDVFLYIALMVTALSAFIMVVSFAVSVHNHRKGKNNDQD